MRTHALADADSREEAGFVTAIVDAHFDAIDLGDGGPQSDPSARPAWQPAEKEGTMRLARAVAQLCRRLTDLNERILAESTARSVRLGRVVNSVHLTFLIAGPIVGVLCGLWVARGLRRSLSEISVTLRDAAGDLDRKVGSVQVRALDDLPALQEQVHAVAERIRRVMEELEQSRQKAMLTERLAAVATFVASKTSGMTPPTEMPDIPFVSRTPNELPQPFSFRDAGIAVLGAVDAHLSLIPI